jgi:Holliday junction resolvase
MSNKINSKTKGKVGELELVHYLNEKGYNVRRTSQYCGQTGDASDVTGLDWVHPEVKRVERLNIDTAMEQAIRDCHDKSKFTIVFHRKNRKSWLVTMRIDDWLEFYEEYLNTHPNIDDKQIK